MSKSLYKKEIDALIDKLIAGGANKHLVISALTEATLKLMKDVQDSGRPRV
jgi:hypothetical protein